MDELDLNIMETLSMLAKIVNRAGRSENGTTPAAPTCKVPTKLLVQAKMLLEKWKDGEYSGSELKEALKRTFD